MISVLPHPIVHVIFFSQSASFCSLNRIAFPPFCFQTFYCAPTSRLLSPHITFIYGQLSVKMSKCQNVVIHFQMISLYLRPSIFISKVTNSEIMQTFFFRCLIMLSCSGKGLWSFFGTQAVQHVQHDVTACTVVHTLLYY